jgi:hypothetical protein
VENRHTNERGMMRKSKRSIAWEEPSPGSSIELDPERDDFDEEIIDLEEVVEPHADVIEEDDELAFDVEILDAETGLTFKDFERKIESEDEFLIEGDPLKELPFFQDREAERDHPQETHVVEEKLEDFGLGFLLAGSEDVLEEVESSGEAPISEEAKPSDTARGLLSASSEGVLDEAESTWEAFLSGESKLADDDLSTEPPVETGVSLDEFITQIEHRLVDTVREIVESRLPEIVRTVLREEIERLKNAQKPEA